MSNSCTKANRTLDFIMHSLSACPHDVKDSAYKRLVYPILEYGSSGLTWLHISIEFEKNIKNESKS